MVAVRSSIDRRACGAPPPRPCCASAGVAARAITPASGRLARIREWSSDERRANMGGPPWDGTKRRVRGDGKVNYRLSESQRRAFAPAGATTTPNLILWASRRAFTTGAHRGAQGTVGNFIVGGGLPGVTSVRPRAPLWLMLFPESVRSLRASHSAESALRFSHRPHDDERAGGTDLVPPAARRAPVPVTVFRRDIRRLVDLDGVDVRRSIDVPPSSR